MPKVVPDQHGKFLTDAFFRKLKEGSKIRFKTCGGRGNSLLDSCRSKKLNVSLLDCGIILELIFDEFLCDPGTSPTLGTSVVLLNRLSNRVDFLSRCIIEGVCVVVTGFLSTISLEGDLKVDFDVEAARKEDEVLQKQIKLYNNMEIHHLFLQQSQQQKFPQHIQHHPYKSPEKFDVTHKNERKIKTEKTKRKTTINTINETQTQNIQKENAQPSLQQQQPPSSNISHRAYINTNDNLNSQNVQTNKNQYENKNTHTNTTDTCNNNTQTYSDTNNSHTHTHNNTHKINTHTSTHTNKTHTTNTHTTNTHTTNTHTTNTHTTNTHCHWKKRLKRISISTYS